MDSPSLRRSIEARFGKNVKRVAIVKKVSTVKTAGRIAFLLGRYVDDSVKGGMEVEGPSAPAVDEEADEDVEFEDRIVEGEAKQREGVDFVRSMPGIRVFGFANSPLFAASDFPHTLSEAEKVRLLIRWWIEQTERNQKKAHHIVFSLDPRVSSELGARRIPADATIISMASTALLAHGNRFYPDASLGWVIGTHHDRFHAHAHALVFPRTSRGVSINVSHWAKAVVRGKPIRVDFQGSIKESYTQMAGRLRAALMVGEPGPNSRTGATEAEEFVASMRVVRDELVKGPGAEARPSPDAFAKGLEAFLARADRVPLLVAKQEAMRSEAPKGKVGAESLDRLQVSLADAADGLESDLQKLRQRRERLTRFFNSQSEGPGSYRSIRYVPDMLPQSPSGTRSYYFDRPISLGSPILTPSVEEVQRVLATRFAEADAVLRGFSAERLMADFDATDMFAGVRRRLAVHIPTAWEYLRRLEALLNAARFGSCVPNISQPFLVHEAEATASVRRRVSADASWFASLNRTASEQELLDLHQHSLLNRRLSDDAPDIDEEVRDLRLPSAPTLIPATANFLERESLTAGFRDIATLEREIELVRERLERALIHRTNIPPPVPKGCLPPATI